ncbi:ABC transporter permease [Ruminiclostridium cellobioparum]|uniref:ABC-type uncharacterized transport system, permease component n=1 Tax=Ruminiclostridium cellobioparum subsp. termitidis CT1112 TaxID=1195236 RepID=S0FNB6_RUMCE|nr:ABC-2 family transporter protein [Ruminiclostridium cellobioparum]EMS70639.1 ABC-type uncharacterized transport system, permease component [Ruminiclostridium cellobioparum subsp. termitidis CT1112]
MRGYLNYTKISMESILAYPFNQWMKFFSKVLFLVMQVCLWNALYQSNGQISTGHGFNETMSYVIVVNIVNTFMESNITAWLNNEIRTGDIVFDLMRPLNFACMTFCKQMGETLLNVIFQTLPLLLISLLLGKNIAFCNSRLGLFLISIALGYIINFLYSYLVGIMAFWLIVTWPLNMLLSAVYKLLSGMWIPVFLFPEFLKSINNYLPFRYIYAVPAMIFTQYLSYEQIANELTAQCLWAGIFFVTAAGVWYLGRKRMVVQGG